LEIIEVSDDGVGIPAASRPLLGQPHATSKRQRGETLGFRGEALYSLAQVARQLVIATRTADEAVAQKFEFSSAAALGHCAPRTSTLARKVGTTVAVVGFLHALPVRQHDLQQRLAYYRHQLRHLVLSYILSYAPRGIQLHWMDLSTTGAETSILRSPPVMAGRDAPSLRDTVAALWGPPVAASLSDVTVDLTDWVQATVTTVDKTTAANTDATTPRYRIEGLISSLTPPAIPTTKSKSAGYFTIQGRPVDLPLVSRLLNDVFRTFVTPPRPCMAILHLSLPPEMFDINLSPDKRLVRFLNEAALESLLRDALHTLWSAQRHAMVPPTVVPTRDEDEPSTLLASSSNHSTGSSITTTASRSYHRRYAFVRDPQLAIRKQEMDDLLLSRAARGELPRKRRWRHSSSLCDDGPMNDREEEDQDEDSNDNNDTALQTTETDGSPADWIPLRLNMDCLDQLNSRGGGTGKNLSFSSVTPSPACDLHLTAVWNDESSEAMATEISAETSSTASHSAAPKPKSCLPRAPVGEPKPYRSSFLDQYGFQALSSSDTVRKEFFTNHPRHVSMDGSSKRSAVSQRAIQRSEPEDVEGPTKEPEVDVQSREERPSSGTEPAMAATSSLWASSPQSTEDVMWASLYDRVARLRNDGRPAPATTPAVVTKDDFPQMTILGQFNLGFILASTTDGNLWILDQHACDEIYNFESLRHTTTLYPQPLIAPLPLELSLAEESCILDHRDIFTANGFRLQYDDAQPPRHRWSLTGLPHSGAPEGRTAVQYGPSDVQALCAILLNLHDENHDSTVVDTSGNQAVRRYAALPKTIALWASRACRGSVMIGQALSRTEMERIVQRLAGVEDPWHCPHGRPTLCHVHAMAPLREADARDHAEQVAGPTLTVVHPTAGAIEENDNEYNFEP
jgi:DNA mismatch repair protein PMS2